MDEILDHVYGLNKKVGELEAENKRLRAALKGHTVELVNALDDEQDRTERLKQQVKLMREALIVARDCIVFDGSLDKENDTIIANRALNKIDQVLKEDQ